MLFGLSTSRMAGNGVLYQVSRWRICGFFCMDSFVVVLDNVLNVRGGVFVLSIFTLGGDVLATLCGGLLLRILVSIQTGIVKTLHKFIFNRKCVS